MAKMIPLISVNLHHQKTIIPKPTKKINVGWLNLNNSFSGQTYFPLSVGLLQSYARKFTAYPDYYEFMPPIFQFPENINETAEILSKADIIGYSMYSWNQAHCLAIAREVKKLNPTIINVFGGPQAPDSKKQFQRIKKTDPGPENLKRGRMSWTEAFHRRNQFIDMVCHGEGEKVFAAILDQVILDGCCNKNSLPSISFIDQNDVFWHNDKLERMSDNELAQAPSPYLDGTFEPLFELYPDMGWIGMWETNRGCPYQCTYCEWGGAIEDKVFKFNMERLHNEAMWFGQKHVNTIFCADANWGVLKRDVEIAEYLAEAKKIFGFPKGVSVQNAKNPKQHTIDALIVLEKAGLNRTAVMSQQSMNKETLHLVRRENMDLSEYLKMQRMAAKEGIYTMTDIIFPMPAETYDSIADGVETLISNGQFNKIQFGIISLWPNSEMNEPEYRKLHGIEAVETDLINIHGQKPVSSSGIRECQELAIATNSMPKPDWVRTRVFTWMTDTIFFNKLLQMPGIILNRYGLKYREYIELFCEDFRKLGDFPILSEIHTLLDNTARAIQEGRQAEFIHSQEWLNIYWPPGEYVFIKLRVEGKLDAFYQEAEKAIREFAGEKKIELPNGLLHDAIKLNRILIKEPFQTSDTEIELSYNVWDIYRQTLLGNQIELESGKFHYIIDRTGETWDTWEDWYQKVVWYGNRRGAYLYGNKNPHQEIAGHH